MRPIAYAAASDGRDDVGELQVELAAVVSPTRSTASAPPISPP